MSSQEISLNNGQQAIIHTDVSKIFLWNNRYITASYTNSGYDDVTLEAGTLMGRVGSTQEVVPLESGASDGSQYPVGILNLTRVVEAGETVDVSICVSGDVAEEKVVLSGSDTMDTLISSRSIRDRIAADTVGIKLVAGTENSAEDND